MELPETATKIVEAAAQAITQAPEIKGPATEALAAAKNCSSGHCR